MHFNAATVMALLPAFGAATSYLQGGWRTQNAMQSYGNGPNEGNNPGDMNAGKGGPGNNECGVSSFVQLTQDASAQPLIKDCQDMLQQITADQSWEITCQGVTIVSCRTCAFNAKVAEHDCSNSAYIGNADVMDLVTDSIDKYGGGDGTIGCKGGFNMYVNSAGGMHCDSPDLPQGHQVAVDWTLTHS